MGFWSFLNFKKRNISSVYKTKYSKDYNGNKYTIFRGKSNYIWVIDNGHGGMIDGTYQTYGKRSPKWEDGSQLFEGVSNRQFVDNITKKLEEMNISYIKLVDTERDTPLEIRTNLANWLYRKEWRRSKKRMIFLSIHSDAYKTKRAKGWSVFTSPGQTKSDLIAEYFGHKFKEIFPDERLRKQTSDGDLDFEARFWVLRKTIMPAILTENFFMTNPYECKEILMNDSKRRLIEKVHYESIKEIDDKKLIG